MTCSNLSLHNCATVLYSMEQPLKLEGGPARSTTVLIWELPVFDPRPARMIPSQYVISEMRPTNKITIHFGKF